MNYFLISIVGLTVIAGLCILCTMIVFLKLSNQKTNLHLLCAFSHRWANMSAVKVIEKQRVGEPRESTDVVQRCLHCNDMRKIRISGVVLNVDYLNAANKHIAKEANISVATKVVKKKPTLTVVPK